MPTTITRQDPRFNIARLTRNGRFPAPDQIVKQVDYCYDAEDVARTLQKALDAGMRPTARSSGHCYEDFIVNNPNGTLIDISQLNQVVTGPTGGAPYSIGPGAMLGNIYLQLYRLASKTIPGGNCYTVTAGGHISGGGYGYLARRFGVTADYVSAVDIVTVDRNGKAVALRADKKNNADLLRALRGGQASNFGIVTAFHFDELPDCPHHSLKANISWDWKDMTPDKFIEIVTTFGKYWQENDQKRETWGLFGALGLSSGPGRINLGVEFSSLDGSADDVAVVTDFLDRFIKCKPLRDMPADSSPHLEAQRGGAGGNPPRPPQVGDTVCYGEHEMLKLPWVAENVGMQGGSGLIADAGRRAKYKSCYMKKPHTEEEAMAFYKMLSGEKARGLIVSIDSYGGATNNPDRIHDTAIAQRSSIMKMQYQTYWQDPKDDDYRLNGIRETYAAAYSTSVADPAHPGVPYPNDHYEGCYINYPDVDMLQHDFWPQLYYGTGDLYPFLQGVKKKYDPHNVFHHAMSIQA
jgi:FAD/FMN-containing dehydrogenase